MTGPIRHGFVLGAGLGTRLRPLTARRPKPLIPIVHKPLVTFAFDHLHAAGVREFVVNTHHCPEVYADALGLTDGRGTYRGCPVRTRHEPVLLDTGGGIANVRDLLGSEPFLVHNGDVLADLDLGLLVETHFRRKNLATLALRSSGGPLQVQCDPATGRLTDIGGGLGGRGEPAFLFTGIAVYDPEIFALFPAEPVFSIIPLLRQAIAEGRPIGGAILDDGLWFDLGTRAACLEVHRLAAARSQMVRYPLDRPWPQWIHPTARVAEGVELAGFAAIGPGARVGTGARLEDCILWDGAEIASRARLVNCIVRDGETASGDRENADF